MTEENKSVKNFPNLRFPEFEGEWEIRCLEEFIDVISGIALKSDEIIEFEKGTPILRGINITEGFIRHSKEIDRFYPKKINEKTEKFILKINDLVIGMDGSKVGKNVALIDEKNIGSILIQRVARIRALNSANIHFIFQKIFSSEFIKYVDLVNTSSGIPHISLQQIKDFKTSFPLNILEQEKIASFLSLLDSRIQTQKKIIEQLETLMRANREKLFSQKLRFKDDGGNYFSDWSLTELKNVCSIIGGGTPDTQKSEFWNGNIQWFTPTEIKSNFVFKSERTISELGLKNSSAKILPKGSILLTTRATIGEVAIAQEECTTNQGFQSLIVKENCNNVFLFHWIKENKLELIKRANGSTFPEISKSEIEVIKILLPSINEQTKIANCLSSIQEKIDTERHILEKLDLQKKFLLANLFV
ncbi:restriction endonuclease subunit S [Chryseobacterium geocarposphaerae]|uniref:Type I restriction enzyme S subunit n=1 Tax=Chryseobacterium geocarposphaerae TaxID=1416776 RepID=A0A2M9C8E1_9FLAO|nr:restriction endonuclease subunit S [Chryseobacterium geocarposphaerae]PJJ67111.1 type I restriction enzyme S subunit [Chryseobacterium geocarposphaerae]